MKQRFLCAALGMGALGMMACAKQAPAGSAPEAIGENARWTASIQSVMQSRGDVAQSTRDRSYGSATWTHGESPSLSSANITFTYAGQERFLSWAIVAGSCGSPSLPIIPMSNFPELNIGGSGRAQVTTSLPVDLPTNGAYHVDIYRSRQPTLDALVACGNLKFVNK